MIQEKDAAKQILQTYKTKPSSHWQLVQQKTLLSVFKTASKKVAAYKKFLRGEKINSAAVRTYQNMLTLPAVSKANYFRKFPLPETAVEGHYENEGLVMTATSGSSGMPTYFPRTERIDWQYSVLAEFFVNNAPKGSTLLIDCFGMGVWIGGLITYQAFRYAALRGYPLTIITPGINKKEIFHALRELAPHFKNVIVAGYPPFVKDILDEAAAEKINFSKFHLRLLFAAESFTENFRDYVCAVGKIKNPYLDTLNIYGSAELGAMAFETPGTIFIRRQALKNPKIFESLFPRGGNPTLAQYNPEFVCFEERDEKILISAPGAVPFVKYDIGDTGGTFTLEHIESAFAEHGLNLKKLARKEHLELLHLPFVFVHERSDFSTTLYGLQIYPQNIKRAIETPSLAKSLTGKFSLETAYDKKSNQYLQIHLEMKRGVTTTRYLRKASEHAIIQNLLKENAEFRELHKTLSHKRVKPKLTFWPYESEQYFKVGGKQKWVKTRN